MSKIICKTIMWLVWLFFALTSILMAHYLTKGIPKLNTFAPTPGIYTIGIFLFPILLCSGLRFWFSRIRNPWLALFPYLIGIIFAQQAGMYGYYLLPEHCIIFQILSAILFVAFFPILIQAPQPPPSMTQPSESTRA